MPTARRRQAERRGRRGETMAAVFLTLKFYRVLGRRVRTHLGEIDLVARAPSGAICFIEVKTRPDFARATESVMPRQQVRIARAAQSYLAARPWLVNAPVRFDIVTVSPGSWPHHVRGAWRPDDVGL